MARATRVVIRPTIGQPINMTTGPPASIPKPYRVRQPDSTEMMVKETAKFENPLIFLNNSWAYPISCSRCLSRSAAVTW
jgi:hypothetical protein